MRVTFEVLITAQTASPPSEHFLGITVPVQQIVKRHPGRFVSGHVRDIPVLIVEAGHENHSQPHRLRSIGNVDRKSVV